MARIQVDEMSGSPVEVQSLNQVPRWLTGVLGYCFSRAGTLEICGDDGPEVEVLPDDRSDTINTPVDGVCRLIGAADEILSMVCSRTTSSNDLPWGVQVCKRASVQVSNAASSCYIDRVSARRRENARHSFWRGCKTAASGQAGQNWRLGRSPSQNRLAQAAALGLAQL